MINAAERHLCSSGAEKPVCQLREPACFRHSWDVRHKRAILLLSLMPLAFASCGGPKTMRPDELRSDIRSAVSLAAETNLFITQMQNDRGTHSFAAGHLGYLRDETLRSAKELRDSQADPAVAESVGTCIAQLDSLVREIAILQDKAEVNDINALLPSRARVADIHDALSSLESGL